MSTSTPAPSLRRPFRFTLLVASIGFLLNYAVLTPIYIRFVSDIAYQNAWWVAVLYYLTVEGLLDLAVFALCYPATVYAVWRAGIKRSLGLSLAFVGLTLFKFILNFFMTGITEGALPDIEEFLAGDLPMILGMFLLEVLQYVLIIAVTAFIRGRCRRNERIIAGMKLLPEVERVEIEPHAPAFPITQLFSLKNPIQLAAFLATLVVFVGRSGMHLVYQITLYINFGSSDGWVIMLIDLISDLVIAGIMYFVYLLLLPAFHRRDEANA